MDLRGGAEDAVGGVIIGAVTDNNGKDGGDTCNNINPVAVADGENGRFEF